MTAVFWLGGITLTILIFYPSLVHKYRTATKRRAQENEWKMQAARNAIADKRLHDEQEQRLQKLRDFRASLPTPEQFRSRFLPRPSSRIALLQTVDPMFFTSYDSFYRDYFSNAKLMGDQFVFDQAKPFLNVVTTNISFEFPDAQRFAGTWIVAPPGRGKTNLLHNLIADDIGKACTIVLMDSKGDLINSYKGYSDVVVIEPHTVEINPFQLGSSTRTLDFLEYIFSALLETKLTPKQTTLFRCCLALMLKIPNATIETFRRLLVQGWKDQEPYVMQLDEMNRDFFFVEGRKSEFDGGQYNETKQEVLQRLRLLVSNDYLKQIFTAPQSNTDFFALLDSRKTIIIDNSKDELGENGAEFFGRFFVAMVWMAAVSRSKLRQDQKVPVYFYIDECHTVIKRDTKITTILDECRSQKIALIMAHQRIGQIEPHVMDALNNCAIRMANSDDDAESLAKRFRVEAPALRLPVGQFSCFVRDTTPQAVTINVPLFDTNIFPPAPNDDYRYTLQPRQQPTYKQQPQPHPVPRDEVEDF